MQARLLHLDSAFIQTFNSRESSPNIGLNSMSNNQTLDHKRLNPSHPDNVQPSHGGGGKNAVDRTSQSGEVSPECVNPDVNASSYPLNILHLSFNQNSSRFAVGTERGFRLFTTDPFMELSRREYGSGIGLVEMIYQSNVIALVGGGSEPMYPLNKLILWNDERGVCISDTAFRSEIKSVRLRRDKIVVVLSQKILVYSFADFKLLHSIETIHNPKGLCEVSQAAGYMVLACLGLMKGRVRIDHYKPRKTKFITAHDSSISNLALTIDGQLLATASSKGTLVRLFDTADGSLLREVRRGRDTADIYSLAFSSTAEWLAVSSDKNTIHVFRLKVDSGSSAIEKSNVTGSSSITSAVSHLPFVKGVLPKYFNSEWSLAQFRLPKGSQYIVAFGHQKNTVVIVGMNGSFYRCQFDPETGGEMKQLEYRNVFNPREGL